MRPTASRVRLEPVEAVEALGTLGGAASYSSLLSLTSRRRVRTALRRGELVRLGRDRYALAAIGEAQQLAELVGGHVSHASAALHYGWEVRNPPADPELIVGTDVVPPSKGRFRLRWYDARPDELRGRVTAPIATVLLCARDLEHAAALAIADSALRHGDVTQEQLVDAARAWPAHVRDLVEQANGAAANPFESVLRSVALEAGYDLVPQFEVRVGANVFHPDLVDPIAGIIVEADSWGFHAEKEDHERDCWRYSILTADGWRVLRFTYEQVMHRPDQVRLCLAMAYGHKILDTPGDTRSRRRVAGRVA